MLLALHQSQQSSSWSLAGPVALVLYVMKNFIRRDSHGHHGSKHAFTHTLTTTQLQPTTWCEATAQLLFFSACSLFSCFRNPPNSDLDYRIFIVRTWSFLCVRVHTGGWAHRQRVSTIYLTRKNSQMFIVLLTGFEPSSFGSESDDLLIKPPRHLTVIDGRLKTELRLLSEDLMNAYILTVSVFFKNRRLQVYLQRRGGNLEHI